MARSAHGAHACLLSRDVPHVFRKVLLLGGPECRAPGTRGTCSSGTCSCLLLIGRLWVIGFRSVS